MCYINNINKEFGWLLHFLGGRKLHVVNIIVGRKSASSPHAVKVLTCVPRIRKCVWGGGGYSQMKLADKAQWFPGSADH